MSLVKAEAIALCCLQTKDFDISNQSPCGHGVVICLSISGGPNLDFRNPSASAASNGAALQKQDTLWIDVMLDDEVNLVFACPLVSCHDVASLHVGRFMG